MSETGGKTSVLLVTDSVKTAASIEKLLPRTRYFPVTTVGSAGEARRTMTDRAYDIVIIRPPLSDELSLRLAEDMLRYETTGVIILADGEQYEQLLWQAEDMGVIVLQRPVDGQMFRQALSIITSASQRLKKLKHRAVSLQSRMDEIKDINRAKLLLMENRKMTEIEAHRYIEKTALDNGIKRLDVAARIIENFQLRNN